MSTVGSRSLASQDFHSHAFCDSMDQPQAGWDHCSHCGGWNPHMFAVKPLFLWDFYQSYFAHNTKSVMSTTDFGTHLAAGRWRSKVLSLSSNCVEV